MVLFSTIWHAYYNKYRHEIGCWSQVSLSRLPVHCDASEHGTVLRAVLRMQLMKLKFFYFKHCYAGPHLIYRRVLGPGSRRTCAPNWRTRSPPASGSLIARCLNCSSNWAPRSIPQSLASSCFLTSFNTHCILYVNNFNLSICMLIIRGVSVNVNIM